MSIYTSRNLNALLLSSLCYSFSLLANDLSVLNLSKSIRINALIAHTDGFLYASSSDGDESEQVIYRIDQQSGKVTLFATGLDTPESMSEGINGEIYVAEWNTGNIMKISSDGKSELFVNELGVPKAILTAVDGTIWVAFQWIGDIKLYHYDITGEELAQISVKNVSIEGAVLLAGNIYAVDEYLGIFYKISTDGTKNILATAPEHNYQYGIRKLLHKNGSYYTADGGKHVIYQISPQGEFKVVAGELRKSGFLSNKFPNRLSSPNAMASFAETNKIYVSQKQYQATAQLKIITLPEKLTKEKQ